MKGASRILYSLVTILVMTGCLGEDTQYNEYTMHCIAAGEHYSNNHSIVNSITSKRSITADIVFDNTCVYDNKVLKEENRSDINKLIGISDAYNHTYASARFGWRCMDNNTIEILTYTRQMGTFKSESLASVFPGETHRYSIEITDCEYRYRFDNHVRTYIRIEQYNGLRWGLYPYFGGSEPAMQDMCIKIKSDL